MARLTELLHAVTRFLRGRRLDRAKRRNEAAADRLDRAVREVLRK